MIKYYKYIDCVRAHGSAHTELILDTLSIMMYILGLIVDCAKVVAVIVAFLTVFGFIKYFSMRCHGLLPSVAATAFVFSLVTSNLAEMFGVVLLLWAKLSAVFSLFSGGFTVLFVLFAILLCCAIYTKLDVTKFSSVGISKYKCKTGKSATVERSLSNSFLAITPVLLS